MDTKVFSSTSKGKHAYHLMMQARSRNDRMDTIDNLNKGATPDEQLRTAITAIEAGLQIEDWDCIAEGCCIIQDVEVFLREVTRLVKKERNRGVS